MSTSEHELEYLREEFEKREAGVAELMELYEKVERVYAEAAASMTENEGVYTSDSTDVVKPVAHLG